MDNLIFFIVHQPPYCPIVCHSDMNGSGTPTKGDGGDRASPSRAAAATYWEKASSRAPGHDADRTSSPGRLLAFQDLLIEAKRVDRSTPSSPITSAAWHLRASPERLWAF